MLPVTILTGFLGSGKTTIVNYLLTHNDGERIAIVENEFGEVSIDSQLLKNSEAMELIELSNGCICCSVRGELTEALHELLDKIDAKQINIDRLILETTGLADPGPIIQAFFVDERVRAHIYLDAVITLVDCEHIEKQLSEHRVASAQIGFADRIILTKSDRVNDELVASVIARIHKINAKADIMNASFGVLPKSAWLDIHAFELDNHLSVTQGSFSVVSSPNDQDNLTFTPFSKVTQERSWSDDVQSYVLRGTQMDLEKIGIFMEQMIEEYGNDMLRYKGILAIKGDDRRLIVQGIHKVVGFDYGDSWDKEPESLLVVIGRNLPIEKLKTGFTYCLA